MRETGAWSWQGNNRVFRPSSEADRFAFAPVNGALGGQQADSFVERHGERIRDTRRRGRGAGINPSGRFRAASRGMFSTMAGRRSTICRRSRPKCRWKHRARSSPATNRRMFLSTGPSIPIAAANMAASIASPGRPIPIWAFRQDWISKPSCSPNPMLPSCCARNSPLLGMSHAAIAMGTNTDPYQPIEKDWRVTREILEVLEDCNHPVGIVTKGALVARDIDILARMARKGLARVAVSVTTLDRKLSRSMEPTRSDTDIAAGNHPQTDRCRHSDIRSGRADDSGDQRSGDGAHSGRRQGQRCAGCGLYAACACPMKLPGFSRTGCCATTPTNTPMSCR